MRFNFKNYSIVILLTVAALIISISFISVHMKEKDVYERPEQDVPVDEIEEKVPEPFVGLLIGLDKSEGLTDVIMVAYMDTTINEVKIISVPRDLMIDFRQEEFKEIKKNNPKNRILYSKLNEVYSLSGWDNRALRDVKDIVSIITGLEINYMATIDVNGFKDVVDAIGGVEFYVPQNMYYNDSFQGLHINLKEGLQSLDGDKAEQLVRYRHYRDGDLQRIQVQQDFMVAIMEKIMNINSFDQISSLISTVYNMFEADFGVMFVLEYAEYFFNLNIKDVLKSENMITVPATSEKINNIWYLRWDIDKVHSAVNELLGNY
jgi:LCP family protein required for cell wall assembly